MVRLNRFESFMYLRPGTLNLFLSVQFLSLLSSMENSKLAMLSGIKSTGHKESGFSSGNGSGHASGGVASGSGNGVSSLGKLNSKAALRSAELQKSKTNLLSVIEQGEEASEIKPVV